MDDKIYDRPSEVSAKDRVVIVDGPDAVAIQLTPEAAEETSHRLLDGPITAKGQERLRTVPRRRPESTAD